MSYRSTLQADALKLVAKKLQSSLAVEGELTKEGLAAFGDEGDDPMMALARRKPRRVKRLLLRPETPRARPRNCRRSCDARNASQRAA